MHRDTRRKVANEWQYAREWGEGGAQREHWSALARADAYAVSDRSIDWRHQVDLISAHC